MFSGTAELVGSERLARQSTFHVRSGVWLLPHKRHSSGGHPCHPRIQVAMCDVPFAGLPGIGSTPGRWWIPRLRPMPPTHTTSQLGALEGPVASGLQKTPLASKCGCCPPQRPKLLLFLVLLPARLTATSCVFLATVHGGFVSPLAVDQEHMMHTQGLKGACANPNTSAALSKAMSTTAEERKRLNPSDSPYGYTLSWIPFPLLAQR